MKDVDRTAEERAGKPAQEPVGAAFESDRQRARRARAEQFASLDGKDVHRISAVSESATGTGRKPRYAAYCRVSTDNEEQAGSIEMQKREYADKIRANPDWEYAGTYVDDGYSGTNVQHRQGFQMLMKDAMAGLLDGIVTKSVSRFARNLVDCLSWVDKLKNLDPPVRVLFDQEQIDTLSSTSGVILTVLAMVAQEESHMKSEAILLSIEWRFSRGRFLTPRLFGYDIAEVPDGYGKRKILSINEPEARVVRWMYSSLVSGATVEDIALRLTELAIPTGGRRRDGTPNTTWSARKVGALLRSERYCGDVLARKTYTPDYKTHKSKKNNGKKNKYFQANHHDAIVSRAVWNAAQRILISRRYRHEGVYLPMRVILSGPLKGFISMNRSWAGYTFEDYYRVSRIAMGLLDENIEENLEDEYLPEGGRRLGGLMDDQGISQIAREVAEAERQIDEELNDEGWREELSAKKEAAKYYQVVSGNMFSTAAEPVLRVKETTIGFSKTCVKRMPAAQFIELLFNPVERMIVVRPCDADHPNAIPWKPENMGATALCRILYESMEGYGWEKGFSFQIRCQAISNHRIETSGHTVLAFDMDNFIGREIGAKKNHEPDDRPVVRRGMSNTGRSYFFPPDEEEPIEILPSEEAQERIQETEAVNRITFGLPVFEHSEEIQFHSDEGTASDEWDMMRAATLIGAAHEQDQQLIEEMIAEITENPPPLQIGEAEFSVLDTQ